MGKYQGLPPLDGPIGAGREEPAALYGNRLFGSSLCGLDRFGLEAGLLLRVVRDAPEGGLSDCAACSRANPALICTDTAQGAATQD